MFEEEDDAYDGPDKAVEFDFLKTRNPYTNSIPDGQLMDAINLTQRAKQSNSLQTRSSLPVWTERGPSFDVAGPFANQRPNSDGTAGRIRATWVDLRDATKKTVWVGAASGGLWKTTDITSTTPNWTTKTDLLSNLAITGICQDPTNTNTMYMCTGEATFNGGATQGAGVFKSTNNGGDWTLLPNTTAYNRCYKIACDAAGNVYLATRGQSLLRSTNGGDDWTSIHPTGLSNRAVDFEISSTGRLHLACDYWSTSNGYRYTDNPATVTSATWTTPTTPFAYPQGDRSRCDLAVLGATVYAMTVDNAGFITQFHKSTDGGATWTSSTLNATDKANLNGTSDNSQGWYCIAMAIDPSDVNTVVLGNLNCIKTTNGGASWTKMSEWVGTTGQYVHADVHDMIWYDNGNKFIIASDGGIFYSTDKGATIRDRNKQLRVKQFYSGVLHPTLPNYILGGAQDNGTHAMNAAGLGTSTEVTGGDGAFCAIDKADPMFQFGAYTYNQYRRSTDGGATWTDVNFSANEGQFINPYDYDQTNKRIYAAHNADSYLRWNDPKTGNASDIVPVTAFNGSKVSTVKVSPFQSNTVFFGTAGLAATQNTAATQGRIFKVDNAHTATPTVTNISDANFPESSNVSCINTGTTAQNLITCFSNYGVARIWVSTNGGTSWTNIDGNLLDMPVRWIMFRPNDNTKAYIATETGVWETALINGASTVWTVHNTFPNVRTDMLDYRASDRTLLAASYGRGFWTTTLTDVVPVSLTDFRAVDKGSYIALNWHTASEQNNKGFDIEKSSDGVRFKKIGFVNGNGTTQKESNYTFNDNAVISDVQYYRLKQLDNDGKFTYSKVVTIKGTATPLDVISMSNPFTSSLDIWLTQTVSTYSFELYDISGRLVYTSPKTTANNNTLSVNLPSLNSGIYVARLTVGNKEFTRKVMKL